MPQPLNARRGEQWQSCDRCGRLFPDSDLVKQKGILVCVSRCFDNLEVEQRDFIISSILNSGVDQEGVDTTQIDRGLFEGFDQLNN